jgi:2-oxoisovalerate dehydrogenase E2 component (dihydrolipoyl transacylase)
MRLPDVGEGVAEAELVEWFVAVGDEVTPESVLAEVLTDKATVEVSSPVAGVVTALHGEPGDVLAVGGELVEIDTGGDDTDDDAKPEEPTAVVEATERADATPAVEPAPGTSPAPIEEAPKPQQPKPDRPTASPAVRQRARALGLDLASISGSGPAGRVEHADLDRLLLDSTGVRARPAAPRESGVAVGTSEQVRGVRRRIAERLTNTWTQVPHITYVDAVDVSELERLRGQLNDQPPDR